MEVGTAGLRRPAREMYPHPDFLSALSRRRIPIIISSDAHYPEHVGCDFPLAVSYARSAGYTSLTRFSGRSPSQVPLG
jgi:histidinol-phosphatase (PHP family)